MGTTTDKLTKIRASKADAKDAIIYKGVSCDNEFDKYAERILQIETPIPPPPPPETTTLYRPTLTAMSDGTGDTFGNFSNNSVLGTNSNALSWHTLEGRSNWGTGLNVYYNGIAVGKIAEGSSFGVDVSKKGLFLRLPYVNNARTLGIQANSDGSIQALFTFPAPTGIEVSAATKIEFYLVDAIAVQESSPTFWGGGVSYAYCRYTNEEIV